MASAAAASTRFNAVPLRPHGDGVRGLHPSQRCAAPPPRRGRPRPPPVSTLCRSAPTARASAASTRLNAVPLRPHAPNPNPVPLRPTARASAACSLHPSQRCAAPPPRRGRPRSAASTRLNAVPLRPHGDGVRGLQPPPVSTLCRSAPTKKDSQEESDGDILKDNRTFSALK
ncbi:translation initiation factor IF-2-like [Takifugu flavidus]|uniref:translation initiation factor IF-2-like n=1 Tax=Takifugu flavidus TaxID=433684 RepID=UPI002544A265|nr:translation initiation factor IF-2-like [Takifugu flavidus]